MAPEKHLNSGKLLQADMGQGHTLGRQFLFPCPAPGALHAPDSPHPVGNLWVPRDNLGTSAIQTARECGERGGPPFLGRARRCHLRSPYALDCVLAVSDQGENDPMWHSHISLCCLGIRRGSFRALEPTMGGTEPFSSSFLYSYRGLVSWVLATSLLTSIYLFDQCGVP